MTSLPALESANSFMDMLADILRLPEETLAMSYAYMHRYWRFQASAVPVDLLDPYTVALCTLSLATKSTESPRRLRSLLLPAYRLLHPSSAPLVIPSAQYDTLRNTLVRAEMLVLRVLKFELRIPLPFEYLGKYIERALGAVEVEDIEGLGRERREEYRVVDVGDTGLGRVCREMVAQACRDYNLSNFFPARTVAAACLWRALERRGQLNHEQRQRWLVEVTGGKVDQTDFDEGLDELEKTGKLWTT